MKRRRVIVGLVVVTLVAVVTYRVVATRLADRPHKTDRRFDVNKWLFATIKSADQVTLFEGLPHSMFERQLLEEEKRLKPTIDLNGYPFYVQPLELTDADRNRLIELLGNAGNFFPLPEGAAKACGGFHPDFGVRWAVGEQLYSCLICFGCGEVMVFGPGGELHCDVEARDHLKRLLVPYWKNRPAGVTWPPVLRDPTDPKS